MERNFRCIHIQRVDMQNLLKDKEKLNILQRKHRVVLDGLFRVNKSSEVHGDRQKEAE